MYGVTVTVRSKRADHLKGTRRFDPNQILGSAAAMICDLDPLAEYEGVTAADADPAIGAEWAPRIREAMSKWRRFQRLLDEMERRAAASTARTCAHCGGPIPESAGQSRYCRRSCRQRAYEARKVSQ